VPLPAAPGPAPTDDPDDANVLPAIAARSAHAAPSDPGCPAPIPPHGFPRAGQPDPNHGGTGDDPPMASGLAVPTGESTQPFGGSLLRTGGMT
jgi:hypothetical protein